MLLSVILGRPPGLPETPAGQGRPRGFAVFLLFSGGLRPLGLRFFVGIASSLPHFQLRGNSCPHPVARHAPARLAVVADSLAAAPARPPLAVVSPALARQAGRAYPMPIVQRPPTVAPRRQSRPGSTLLAYALGVQPARQPVVYPHPVARQRVGLQPAQHTRQAAGTDRSLPLALAIARVSRAVWQGHPPPTPPRIGPFRAVPAPPHSPPRQPRRQGGGIEQSPRSTPLRISPVSSSLPLPKCHRRLSVCTRFRPAGEPRPTSAGPRCLT